MLPVLLLLAGCGQDETLSTAGDDLPSGTYPLQIGNITLTIESAEEPWTRVAETNNGSGSEFRAGDAITVSLDNETTTYTYNGSTWTSDAPLYWKNTQAATVTAWYPVADEIDFTNQDKGLTYLLKGSGTASYQSPVTLNFTHQLAKVRVVLDGSKANEVESVTVRSYPTSTHTQGTLDAQPATPSPEYVPMLNTSYDGQKCWEANLRPGRLVANNSFQVAKANSNPVQVTLDADVSIDAGHLYTITINVNPAIPEDAKVITSATIISDDGDYVVRNELNAAITITGGSPHIYLYGANVSVGSGPAISITGNASPTIHVVGNNNEVKTTASTNNRAAGIYVAQGSSVTIEGRGTDDVLRVTGGADGAAIGGYSPALNSHNPCGDITIHNVTLYAYALSAYQYNLPIGIGSTGTAACGKIEITDAIVHAWGYSSLNESTPAIGAYSSVPQIVISGSTIHAYRGAYNNSCFADYIGRGGNTIVYQGGQIQCGSGGSITGSTVYKYSYDVLTGSSSNDGSETF